MSERAMIELRGLTKRYGDALAADSVTLDIAAGRVLLAARALAAAARRRRCG